jgi:hypothetical protein
MICIRIHTRGTECLVAACDGEVLGKTYREGKLKLEISESFYKDDEVDEEALVNWLRLATVANLVGERTVAIAVKHGFIDEACIIRIGGIPHAQMARMI